MDLSNAFGEWASESLTLSNLHVYAAFEAVMRDEEE